ncbi:MAG: monofunctional biosynthetic peptidoglycan transglycosylase [Syntrophales bacterium]
MWKKLIFVTLIILVGALSLNIGYYFLLPDVAALGKANPKKTAFMEYREKEWQRDGKKKKIQQRWVSLSQISPYVVKAVIIAEDDKFWNHEGFDFEAMQKAIEKDIKKRKFKVGGSTISQQLAKNLYLSPSKNPIRKVKEAILTRRIEEHLSKKRIIEIYLNVAEWGDGVFGIEMAARTHFGKSAAALNAQEASRLAAVLPNPLKFNPTGTSRYVSGRAERIYQIMVRRGIVIPEYEDVMKDGTDLGVQLENQDPEAMKKLENQVNSWKKEAVEASRKTELPVQEKGGKESDRD